MCFIFIAPKYVNFFRLHYKSFLIYYAAAAHPVAKNNLLTFCSKMLTGIEKPTLGTASVLGFDTWGQWGEVQKLIGKKNAFKK